LLKLPPKIYSYLKTLSLNGVEPSYQEHGKITNARAFF